MEEIPTGKVEKFFGKISVAAVRITGGELKVGDRIRIKGHTTDFEQTVDSIQVEHATVQKVGIGDEVGIKVKERVHEHDTVYVVRE
ncbi:MAG: EF-Tu/IF-2/RF-3 family GTPase [Syntrophorhabdales bacterium]|jgi:putative protease